MNGGTDGHDFVSKIPKPDKAITTVIVHKGGKLKMPSKDIMGSGLMGYNDFEDNELDLNDKSKRKRVMNNGPQVLDVMQMVTETEITMNA